VLPDVPTVAEAGVPGFEAFTWYGLFAPAATPRPIIDLLNTRLNAALQTQGAKDNFAKQSIDVAGGPPEVLAKQVQNEIARWTSVAKQKGIKVSE
jgi:tripartite-type tricarboxylate transporter receptor subunit TctC